MKWSYWYAKLNERDEEATVLALSSCRVYTRELACVRTASRRLLLVGHTDVSDGIGEQGYRGSAYQRARVLRYRIHGGGWSWIRRSRRRDTLILILTPHKTRLGTEHYRERGLSQSTFSYFDPIIMGLFYEYVVLLLLLKTTRAIFFFRI